MAAPGSINLDTDIIAQLPGLVNTAIGEVLDDQSLHNFRIASRHARFDTLHEITRRNCQHTTVRIRGPHVNILAGQLRTTVTPATATNAGSIRGDFVHHLYFENGTGAIGIRNVQINRFQQFLLLTPDVRRISIQTQGATTSDIIFSALLQTPIASGPRIRHLNVAGDVGHTISPRPTGQQLLGLLTLHSATLQSLRLDTAMFSRLDWDPILAYIRDHMNLDHFTFFHCAHTVLTTPPLLTFSAQTTQTWGVGQSWISSGNAADMDGAQTVRRGANRLLIGLNLPSQDQNLPQ